MKYEKVFDSRHRRARGLWKRNGTFFAQMRVQGHTQPVRYPLHSAKTVAEAITEQQVLKKKRREGTLEWPPAGSRSREVVVEQGAELARTLSKAIDDYLVHIKHMGKKRKGTIEKETTSLNHWKEKFGSLEVAAFTFGHVHQFASWRKEKKINGRQVSGRTIDVDVIVMRHVLHHEVQSGHLFVQPIGKWKKLAGAARVKRLISSQEIQTLRDAALKHLRYDGQNFSDYLGVLAYSGAREKETYRLRWSMNVDWDNHRLNFGLDGLSKFGKQRWVRMNPKLEAHLREMHLRRDQNCDYLFPSRITGEAVKTFKESLRVVKEKTGIKDVTFHMFRHYFASQCVMAGIDYKTIADWLAHADGGVLIGKVYGHLNNEHVEKMAEKLKFAA
jgi:integrase